MDELFDDLEIGRTVINKWPLRFAYDLERGYTLTARRRIENLNSEDGFSDIAFHVCAEGEPPSIGSKQWNELKSRAIAKLDEYEEKNLKNGKIRQSGKQYVNIVIDNEVKSHERVANDPFVILGIENPSEEEQLASVRKLGRMIKYIENPSEKVKLAAIMEDENAIKYIENPTEELQLISVKGCGEAIKYIKNPTEKVQLAAIEKDIEAFQYLKNPTEKVLEEAFKIIKG